MITEKECRICLEKDKFDEFIHPCLCDGTSKWVHSSCINRWRELNINRKGYYQCMECNYKYKFTRELILESYKFESIELIYILSGFICYVLSFIMGYMLYLIDVKNDMLSVKILTYGNNELLESTRKLFINEFYFSVYYSDLFMCVLYNIWQIKFFCITLFNVNRKLLYLNLFKKQLVYNILLFNNIFYVYFFWGIIGGEEFYFIGSPFMNMYLLKLLYYLSIKHNKIIRLMNIKYNNQELLNYNELEEVIEETEVALLDGESETQNFENIEIGS